MLKKAVRKALDLIAKALLLLIRAYQLLISSWTKNNCRFYPSCSNYAKLVIQEHGPVRGLYFTLRRLLRCHPFHPGGVDPVPEKRVKPYGH